MHPIIPLVALGQAFIIMAGFYYRGPKTAESQPKKDEPNVDVTEKIQVQSVIKLYQSICFKRNTVKKKTSEGDLEKMVKELYSL